MENKNDVSIYRVVQGSRLIDYIMRRFIEGNLIQSKETLWMYFEYYATKYGKVMCIREKSDGLIYNITANKKFFEKVCEEMKRG